MASWKPWERLIPRDNPFLPGWKPKKPSSNSRGHNDDESSQDGEGGEEMPVCDPFAMPQGRAWGKTHVGEIGDEGDAILPSPEPAPEQVVRALLLEGQKLHTIFTWLKEEVETEWEKLLPETTSWKELLERGRSMLRRTLLHEHNYPPNEKRYCQDRRSKVDAKYLEDVP